MFTTVLKYAGNKSRLMDVIRPHLGTWEGTRRYVEPFCGALGSSLNAGIPDGIKIELSDANKELVELYEELRRAPEELEVLANSYATDEDSYYEIRAWDRSPGWPYNKTKLERAARTLYLNKRGFNGLYRINNKGFFTAAWCKNPTPRRIDVLSHKEFLSFLDKVHIKNRDWKTIVDECGEGDVVYCDPPYVNTKEPTKNFAGYIGEFGWSSQKELKDSLLNASSRGARVVASNAWCKETVELYDGFAMKEITAHRSISANDGSRGKISELLAWLPRS